MSAKLAIVLVAIIFLVTVIVRMPASVLALLLPQNLACQDPSGTIWQGACGQLRSGPVSLADLHWTLHALPLLRGQAQFDLRSDDPRGAGRGRITLHANGDADVDSLTAAVPLQGASSPLPAGWSGQIELAIAHAQLRQHQLVAIEGVATAQQLHIDRPAIDLGSFELRFPHSAEGAPSIGSLRDIGGPIALQGDVQLAHGGYELNASLVPRDPGNTSLAQLLGLLGPPDAQGRHELSIAGTF
ncbi:MAG: type II secretion system protein N [Steroidobacteraceae bacterium]